MSYMAHECWTFLGHECFLDSERGFQVEVILEKPYQVIWACSKQKTVSEWKKTTIYDRKGKRFQPSCTWLGERSQNYIGTSCLNVFLKADNGSNSSGCIPKTLIQVKATALPISLLGKGLDEFLELSFRFFSVGKLFGIPFFSIGKDVKDNDWVVWKFRKPIYLIILTSNTNIVIKL